MTHRVTSSPVCNVLSIQINCVFVKFTFEYINYNFNRPISTLSLRYMKLVHLQLYRTALFIVIVYRYILISMNTDTEIPPPESLYVLPPEWYLYSVLILL